jgi:hypothetical protein
MSDVVCKMTVEQAARMKKVIDGKATLDALMRQFIEMGHEKLQVLHDERDAIWNEVRAENNLTDENYSMDILTLEISREEDEKDDHSEGVPFDIGNALGKIIPINLAEGAECDDPNCITCRLKDTLKRLVTAKRLNHADTDQSVNDNLLKEAERLRALADELEEEENKKKGE